MPPSIIPESSVCWFLFIVQVYCSKFLCSPFSPSFETERRDTRKLGTYSVWIVIVWSSTGPPCVDRMIFPSPSLIGIGCRNLSSDRKFFWLLNMWCDAPESISIAGGVYSEDRRIVEVR